MEGGNRVILPGVNIYWDNSSLGTVSEKGGTFSIGKEEGNQTLVFSFVGYRTQKVNTGGSGTVEVVLQSDLELPEVKVVKKNNGRNISSFAPILTETINGAELLKAACCNLAESFETNPSVDVSYSDAVTGAKQIRLLGLDGIYSQLQTGNIPNFRGLATNFGLTYIPGPWMESIQVSKGTSSVVNGYESITGQINVAYKKPDSKEKLHLNGYADADGKLEFNANHNLRLIGDKLTTGLFLHVENISTRVDQNHDGFMDQPLVSQAHFYNAWKFNNQKGLMIHGDLHYLWDDRLGGETDFRREMARRQSNPYGTGITNHMAEASFKIGNTWASGHTALALLSDFAVHDMNSFYGLNNYDGNEKRYYANLILTQDLDNKSVHVLNSGVSYFYDHFKEILNSGRAGRFESVPGVFSEYTFKPSGKITLMAGIRADLHNIYDLFVTPRAHLRYQPDPRFTLRASAGKGYRTSNVLAENSYLLANSRSLGFMEQIQEEAWNFGISFIQKYRLLERDLQITAEYFRTDFLKQLVVDKESSAETIFLHPLNGKSFANTSQVEVRYPVIRNLDLTVAYRSNDIKQTIDGLLREKPYISRYKGLITANYTSRLKKWMFDFTIQLNGGGRLPVYHASGAGSDGESMSSEFPSYTLMNLQISRFFRYLNIYLGSENLTDFTQDHPVLGADNPYLPGFDATNIWGPVMGRRIYAGIRFTLNYE